MKCLKEVDCLGSKALIVGSGAQGRVIAYFFDRDEDMELVKLTDIDRRTLDYCMKFYRKAETHVVSAEDVETLSKLAEDVDILVNAVPVKFNLKLMEAALKAGTNYLDMAFEYRDFEKIIGLHEKFRSEDLTALVAFGVSPGLTDVVVGLAADELDGVEEVRILLGGREESDVVYTTWSPEIFLDDCTRAPMVYEDGEIKYLEPFSEPEVVELPGVGKVRVYAHPHEEVFTVSKSVKGVRRVIVKMGGEEMDFLCTLYRMGILYKDAMVRGRKVRIDDVEVDPARLILKFLPRPITGEELREYVERGLIREVKGTVLVEVKGLKDGRRCVIRSYSPIPPIREIVEAVPLANETSYVTSLCAYTAAKMVVDGSIKSRGVLFPEELTREERLEFVKRIGAFRPPIKVKTEMSMDLN